MTWRKNMFRKWLKIKRIKTGFTLAEVLITLGIIGVVAAITIPNLIANYKAQRLRFKDGVLRTMGDINTQFQGDRYCDFDKVKTTSPSSNYGIACAQKAKQDSEYFKTLVKKYK